MTDFHILDNSYDCVQDHEGTTGIPFLIAVFLRMKWYPDTIKTIKIKISIQAKIIPTTTESECGSRSEGRG